MPASITLETIMKEKKKLTYKQQQKREKAKTIVKWVFCGLGWSLLATAFVSLLVVGIRGCNNKKQPAQALTGQVTTPVKPVQPNNVVTPTNTTSGNNNPPIINPVDRVAGIIGANDLGTSYNVYKWIRSQDADPYPFSRDVGLTYLGCTTLQLGKIECIGVNQSDNVNANFDYIEHDYEGMTIDFTLDGNVVAYFDERDWTLANKWQSITITFNNVSTAYISDTASQYSYGWAYNGTSGGTTYSQMDIGLLLGEFMSSETLLIDNSGGESDTETGLTGIFTLIARAFGTFANLFNYQIIPGLTIGTFIALPLVATAIFFIVKLFKR